MKVRIPFLVSVGQRLYVHFSEVTQKQAMSAFKGMLNPVRDQVTAEIRETDGVGDVEVIGQMAWGASQNTVSLSEFGLTSESLD